jgi:transcriptional antiterminator
MIYLGSDMWLTSVQRQILVAFLSTDKEVSISEVADALGMSGSTVRRSLPSLRVWLGKYGSSILKQIDGKMWIQSGEITKRSLLEKLSEEQAPPSTLGRQDRIDLLTFSIHISSKPRIVQDFQNELQVSRSTILDDLAEIARWYETRHLFLIRRTNFGVKLMGQEEDWRKVLVELIWQHLDEATLFHITNNAPHTSIPLSLTNPPLARMLVNYLATLRLPDARELVRLAESRMRTRFIDYDHLVLALNIALLILRVQEKNIVEMNAAQIQSLVDQPAYRVAFDLAQNIQRKWQIVVPQSEVAFLAINLLSAKLDNRLVGDLPPESEQLARSVLDRAAKTLKQPLDQDRDLIIRLASHLAPTIQRLRRDFPIRNPLLVDIRSRYPEIFKTAEESCDALRDYIGKEVPQDEVAYIAMYLAGAMMKYEEQPKVRALVVCPSGSATSWLLHSRLKKEFMNIQVMDICSTRDLQRGIPENVDVIISTIPLQKVNVPTIIVSALLPSEDIRQIQLSLEELAS